ncbi:MAG: hypothetical protein WAU01_14460 [Saprospiraceae bacterium]
MKTDIIGTWDVYSSEMNNKPNGFMKDGWFSFEENNTMTSNIFPDQDEIGYKIKNGKLYIDIDQPLQLEISKMTSDTMIIEGKVSYYFMKYKMRKRS